jgi:hypothetical protein
MANGQRAASPSSAARNSVGSACRKHGVRRIVWSGGEGPELARRELWLCGSYEGDPARFAYNLDGKTFVNSGGTYTLRFSQWKGPRFGLFSYGEGGAADFDYLRYEHGRE